jgi:hypothetical protein
VQVDFLLIFVFDEISKATVLTRAVEILLLLGIVALFGI